MSEQRQVFEDPEGVLRRRAIDPAIEMMVHKMGRVEQSVDKMAEAVTKLAVVEERQISDRQALERAFVAIQQNDTRNVEMHEKVLTKLDVMDTRIDSLEKTAPTNALTSGWILDAVKALAVVVAVLVFTKLGIMQ